MSKIAVSPFLLKFKVMSVLWKAAVHYAIINSSHLQSDVSDMTPQGFLVKLGIRHIQCFIRVGNKTRQYLNRDKFPLHTIHSSAKCNKMSAGSVTFNVGFR